MKRSVIAIITSPTIAIIVSLLVSCFVGHHFGYVEGYKSGENEWTTKVAFFHGVKYTLQQLATTNIFLVPDCSGASSISLSNCILISLTNTSTLLSLSDNTNSVIQYNSVNDSFFSDWDAGTENEKGDGK